MRKKMLALLVLSSLSSLALANCPTGWTNVSSGKSVRLCQKGNLFVQRVDLSGGARVRLVYSFNGSQGSFSNPNPNFNANDIWGWWNFATTNNGNNVIAKPSGALYSVVSGGFFNGNYGGPIQTPAYPIKNRGNLLSVGSSNDNADFRDLRLNDSDASIATPSSPLPRDWNQVANIVGPFTSVFGLFPGTTDDGSKGRTYVGLRDNNGDGKFEWIIFLSTNNAKKADVYAALRNDFGTQVNIQFDGSGTSQMISRGNEYVKSSDLFNRRKFPVAFAIYEAP